MTRKNLFIILSVLITALLALWVSIAQGTSGFDGRFRDGAQILDSGEPNNLQIKGYYGLDRFVDPCDYASLAACVTANTSGTVLIKSQHTLTASIDWRTALGVRFQPGGSIVKASTYVVDFNDAPFEAGLHTCFSGFDSGDITGIKAAQILPQWWGATGDGVTDDTAGLFAAAAAAAKCPLYIPAGVYRFSTTLVLDQNDIKIYGASFPSEPWVQEEDSDDPNNMAGTVLRYTGIGGTAIEAGINPDNDGRYLDGFELKNVTLYCDDPNVLIGIRLWHPCRGVVDGVGIVGQNGRQSTIKVGMKLQGTQEFTVRNIKIRGNGSPAFAAGDPNLLDYGIWHDLGYSNASSTTTRFENIMITYCQTAVYHGSHGEWVHCTFEALGDMAFTVGTANVWLNYDGLYVEALPYVGYINGSTGIGSLVTIKNSEIYCTDPNIFQMPAPAAAAMLCLDHCRLFGDSQNKTIFWPNNYGGGRLVMTDNILDPAATSWAVLTAATPLQGTVQQVRFENSGFTYLQGGHIANVHRVVTKTVSIDDDISTPDFKFDDDLADSVAQNVDLGELLPAGAELVSAQIWCSTSVGSGTFQVALGTSSGGTDIFALDLCDAAGELRASAAGAAPVLAATGSARHIWIQGDPDGNWTTAATGIFSVSISYLDYNQARTQHN